jgi:putative transposase
MAQFYFARRRAKWFSFRLRLTRKIYRTREQARTDVFDYIERFYNPFRKHSKLNYPSPVQFEEQQRLEG